MAEKKNIKAIYEQCQLLSSEAEQYAKDHNGEVDPALLPPLEAAFNDILTFEKMYLIAAQDAFYGAMLMNMDVTINFKQRGPIDIAVAKEPFVVSFNPLFCSKYKFAQFTALLVQEILRIAYDHPATYGDLNGENDPNKHIHLEKSSSASVSSMVQNDIRLDSDNQGLRLPDDAYTVSKLADDTKVNPKRDQAMDYYFRVLEKFDRQRNQQSESSKTNVSGQGNPNATATPSNNNGQDVHQWEKNDPDDTSDKIKSMVGDVYSKLSEKQRGFMPAGLVEQINKLLAPPQINWKQLLRKLLGTIPVPYRSTRRRLNRRQPYRTDLSGRLPRRIVNIVVCIDTSGSMSDDDLAYCLNEVFNIAKEHKGTKITIVECDAEIGKVYQAKTMKEVQVQMSGRGGTSYVPAIDFINGEEPYKSKYPNLSGKFRDALMVYFTDGYGDSDIPKPKTFRNLWVVLNDEKNLSLKDPYGEVKSLKEDADYMKMKNGF
jgi:predicted metal-dependent peptidase